MKYICEIGTLSGKLTNERSLKEMKTSIRGETPHRKAVDLKFVVASGIIKTENVISLLKSKLRDKYKRLVIIFTRVCRQLMLGIGKSFKLKLPLESFSAKFSRDLSFMSNAIAMKHSL